MLKLKLVLLCLISYTVVAQPRLPAAKADSLWNVWNNPNEQDTSRLKALYSYAYYGYTFSKPDSAIYFAELELAYAERKNLGNFTAKAYSIIATAHYLKGDYEKAIRFDTKALNDYRSIDHKNGVAKSLHNIAMAHNKLGNYVKAFNYYNQALAIKKSMNDQQGMASTLNNIGNLYYTQGDYDQAVDYYIRSLKIKDEIGDKKGVSKSLNNIGSIYHYQNEFERALDYFHRSLEINRSIDDTKGVGNVLNNIGNVYLNKKDFDKASTYFNQSIEIFEEMGSKNNVAVIQKNIGDVFAGQKKYEQALEKYTESLEMRKELGDQKGVATTLVSIAEIYNKMGAHQKAYAYASDALAKAEKLGAVLVKNDAAKAMWNITRELGRYEESLRMHELYIETNKKLQSEENEKEIIRQELKYEYEKQATADSIKAEEAKKLSEARITAQNAQLREEKTQRWALYGGLAILVVFGVFMYNRFRVTRKQKHIIEKQKSEVERQREIVELKNQEITDSILYAKRIQNAILPTMRLIKEHLPDSFVLYKPKDIVAGDFYWLESTAGKVLFAAADCTGHGVPGAMVSVVCNNGLNRSVREYGITDPGKILDKTRNIVVQEFEKSEEEVKDGMDISLCALDFQNNILMWSGANNPLWIVRKGELIEYKSNKQPIGVVDNPEPFVTHEIGLQKNDVIYIFSDGFQDQFGGEKDKKFKRSNFKKLLIEASDKPIEHQKELIDQAFEDWKGSSEQLDDVCVIGVRV